MKGLFEKGNRINQKFITDMPDAVKLTSTGRIASIDDKFIKPKTIPKFKPPVSSGGTTLHSFPANLPAIYKKLPGVARKAFSWVGGDIVFYYLDKWNEMSKGKSEEEAAAIAKSNATLGVYKNKTYIEGLKKTAEEMGIDPRAFEKVYFLNEDMTKIRKEDERFLRIIKKLESMEDSPEKTKALARMKQGHEKWKKETEPKIDEWSEAVAGQVSISKAAKTFPTPNLDQIAEARRYITREDYKKPFIDIQNVALEKLEKEKAAAYDRQSKQVDPEAGKWGEVIQNVWKGLYTYPKYAFDLVNPYSPLPELGGWKTEEMKEKERIEDMLDFDPKELYRYNKARGLDPDSPLSKKARENLQDEHPGLGFREERAGGGIAGIRRPWAIPPESGPDSQGLAYLNNYATKRTE
jgi:hypothetical protein